MTDYFCCYRCGLHFPSREACTPEHNAGGVRCGSTSFVRNNSPGQEIGRFEIEAPLEAPRRIKFREFL